MSFNPFILIAYNLYKEDFLFIKKRIEFLHKENYSLYNYESIEILKRLLISGEDHRFNYHLGFDIFAIIRAIKNNIFYNKKEGASTIEQQLVRVLTNDFRKSIKRKIKEIILSTTLRYLVPRKSIPLIYLKVAYYGTNMTGISSVLKKKKILIHDPLNEEIAAEIIAMIKYPCPKFLSRKRQCQILNRKFHLLKLYKNHSKRKIIKIYV